jgi:hypothetical protein
MNRALQIVGLVSLVAWGVAFWAAREALRWRA